MDDLHGLVPRDLRPQTRKIVLRDYDLLADVGFHDFEIGAPQRLRINVEVWLDEAVFAVDDSVEAAWNYDILRLAIAELVAKRRYNLQETICRAIYDMIAARQGVIGLCVSTQKPDIYPDCAGVGVELSSFSPSVRVQRPSESSTKR